MSSLQNSDITPEYKISVINEDGSEDILREYSYSKTLDIRGIQ
jgi:hypothetical protein